MELDDLQQRYCHAVTDFKIIGLMDRDNANIGKKIYGVPVLGKEEVREKADLIIINNSINYMENI